MAQNTNCCLVDTKIIRGHNFVATLNKINTFKYLNN